MHYSTLSSMESGKLNAQQSAKSITDQLYKKLEVTCTTVHYKPRVGSYWCISMDCTWTAGFLVGSPVPVQSLLWIGRIMLLVVMTNVFCCCVLFLMGSHFFISYVFSCLTKWFQGCPFCENCFLNSAKVLYMYRKIPI